MRGDSDPLFTSRDYSIAMALQEVEETTCDGCGQPRTESMAPDAEYAYETTLVRCHGCAKRSKSLDAYAESGGNTAGIIALVNKKES